MRTKPPLLRFLDKKMQEYGITQEMVEKAERHNHHVILTLVDKAITVRIDLPPALRDQVS